VTEAAFRDAGNGHPTHVSHGVGWSIGNQAVFRRANEELREFSGHLLAGDEAAFAAVPFLCECGDGSCTRVVRLTLGEYDRVRAREGRFVVLPGHEGPGGRERVVADEERYVVVQGIANGEDQRGRACA
jgi:hypothetical protein